jgi:endogenous inhibitor of DNA gyrase (YacG/DUF329 family)
MIVKCPTCGKTVEWSSDNKFRPFCSSRCKLIDLGAWLDEKMVISDRCSADGSISDELKNVLYCQNETSDADIRGER